MEFRKMAMTTLYARQEKSNMYFNEGIRSYAMPCSPIGEVESEKVGLKLNIQKTKIMASGPFASWQIDGETVETVSDFIFLAPKHCRW